MIVTHTGSQSRKYVKRGRASKKKTAPTATAISVIRSRIPSGNGKKKPRIAV